MSRARIGVGEMLHIGVHTVTLTLGYFCFYKTADISQMPKKKFFSNVHVDSEFYNERYNFSLNMKSSPKNAFKSIIYPHAILCVNDFHSSDEHN